MGRPDIEEMGNPSWAADPTGNSIFCLTECENTVQCLRSLILG